MERTYLLGTWDPPKVMMSLLVPVAFIILGLAFWRRNVWLGMSVLVAIAVSKMLWSVVFRGESGIAIFAPALVGLTLCIALIGAGFRKLKRNGEA